jgi:hypothetical protein
VYYKTEFSNPLQGIPSISFPWVDIERFLGGRKLEVNMESSTAQEVPTELDSITKTQNICSPAI